MKIYFYLFLLFLHQITLSLSSSCLGSSTIVIVTPQDQTWNVDSLDWNTTPERKFNFFNRLMTFIKDFFAIFLYIL